MYHAMRWTYEKIRQRLQLVEPLAYRRRLDLPAFRFLALDGPAVEAPVSPEVDDSAWPSIPWESEWGWPDLDFVLRTRLEVPAAWNEEGGPIALALPIGRVGEFNHPEALAYLDGAVLATCDRQHQEIQLPVGTAGSGTHLLALHGWTGGAPVLRFDLEGPPPDPPWSRLPMGTGQLVQIDLPTRELLALSRVTLGVATALPEREPAKGHLITALDEAFKVLDTREPLGDAFYASVPPALEALRAGIERCGPPLAVDVWAAGHAHIDVAWLWTLAQTRLKAGRTFHNVVRLMERFPSFAFVQSQAQLYEYVRRDYPALYQAVAGCVAEGRWEPVGGMWVEADCNVTGGESLARQFLLGTGFFRREFGPRGETPVLWLPDVFGFPWSLPQLAREAGQRYFFSTKMGWSQYNRFPYDSFWWQGLDGSRLLAHFSPSREGEYSFAGTYNALATPETVLNTWGDFRQKDWGRPGEAPPLLMVYGHGDGGGGPTPEMIENIEIMGSFPATPRTRCGSAAGFFRELEARSGERLPTWNGELYLEFHRGTYTTQARSKQANRRSEFLLHDAEFLASLASALQPPAPYPHERLRRAWQIVCLNQFHDIIPGSSIAAVYRESLEQYAAVLGEAVAIRDEALAHIAAHTGGDLLVANPTSFTRQDLAFWAGGDPAGAGLRRPDGTPVPAQPVDGGLLLDPGPCPPYSIVPLHTGQPGSRLPDPTTAAALTCTPALLENALLRVELDAAGDILRIYDRANGREVLPPGSVANQFQAFEDRPRVPDAWDMDVYYDDRCWTAEPAREVRVVERGPLRACLEVRRRILSSDVTQRISLAHNSRRLDFDTTVEWRERHILLKVAFPLDVLAPEATYEIQWGNVQRPTHRNTSWDWARFEVPAQKWVDLSEGGYGASLLNDGKYGHDVRDNVVRLTLLRSPTSPDPTADLGRHHFLYSLLPHAGGWDESTVSQAYALNDPLIAWPVGGAGAPAGGQGRALSFLNVDQPNVVIETVKQAEDGRGIIVRVYESQRRRGPFRLEAGLPLAAAWRTDLLEQDQELLEVEGHALRAHIRPYQILTMRLEFKVQGKEQT
jgi:alpha-mannosidase